MTTRIQQTLQLIPALILMVGFMIQTQMVHAQSRGRTTGRQSKTESSEKKTSTSTQKKPATQGSSRTSSRQRSTASTSRGSSPSTRQQSSRSSGSSNTRATANRQQANASSRSGSSTNNSRQQDAGRGTASRNSRTGNGSTANSRSRSGNEASPNNSRQQNAGRGTASRGTRTSNGSSTRSTRSGNNANANDSRQQNAGRSTASRGARTNNSSSTRSTGSGNSASRGDSRQQNDGGASTGRSNRAGNGASTRGSSRSGNDANARNSRQQNAGRSTAGRTTRESSGSRNTSATRDQDNSRSTSAGRNSTTNRRTRDVNNGSRQPAARGIINNVNSRQNSVRVERQRNRARRDATGVRVLPAANYGWRNTRNHRVYQNRNWRYKNNRVYVNPVYHHRPHVQVNVVWPWQNRYRRAWRPSYRYCQVVYVESGWGRNRHRAKVDIRTNYHHEVRHADHNKAVVDIYFDEIEVYKDGYLLGRVQRFPRDLEHIEATIYRNGEIVYDRDVFIVGDPYAGFEMISTRSYDGYILDDYNRSHGMEVGRLNFRRKRVDTRRYSRLFDPYDFKGYAPISVLPDDEQLLDYGYDAISYHHYDDNYDPYYGGAYDDIYYNYDNNGNYSAYDAPRGVTHGRDQPFNAGFVTQAQPLTLNRTYEYQTNQGIAVKLQREATLERIK